MVNRSQSYSSNFIDVCLSRIFDQGFLEGLIESDDGKKAVVMVGHEVLNNDRRY